MIFSKLFKNTKIIIGTAILITGTIIANETCRKLFDSSLLDYFKLYTSKTDGELPSSSFILPLIIPTNEPHIEPHNEPLIVLPIDSSIYKEILHFIMLDLEKGKLFLLHHKYKIGILSLLIVMIIVIKYWRGIVPPRPIPVIPKPSGLLNHGEYCYMNSMIQALAGSDVIIKQLKNLKNESGATSEKLSLFIDLIESINNPNSTVADNTAKLSDLIEKINWTKKSQQDSFDLLSKLVNSIQKEINSQITTKIDMPIKIKLYHTFEGIDIPNKAQDHLGLSVGLFGNYSKPPGERLDSLINGYFTYTLIDEDPNKKTKMYFYEKIPQLLLLHIQANKWSSETNEIMKPEYYIIYNEKMSLNLEVYDDKDKKINHNVNVEYKLCSIVKHMGGVSSGHYVAYRKWKNVWFLANDEQVEELKFDTSICPYILIYEYQNSSSNLDN